MNETYKNYVIAALLSITVFQSYKLITLSDSPQICTSKEVVEIATDIQPLPISVDLQRYFEANRIVALTVGFHNGKVGLISIEGKALNPCSDYPGSPCRYDGGLSESHAYIAERTGHGGGHGYPCSKLCKGLDSTFHNCSGSTYYCTTGTTPCQSTCKL
jgi:hypothetical protein